LLLQVEDDNCHLERIGSLARQLTDNEQRSRVEVKFKAPLAQGIRVVRDPVHCNRRLLRALLWNAYRNDEEFHQKSRVRSSTYWRLDFLLLVAVAGRDVNPEY
jgi:hypothetical protein